MEFSYLEFEIFSSNIFLFWVSVTSVVDTNGLARRGEIRRIRGSSCGDKEQTGAG